MGARPAPVVPSLPASPAWSARSGPVPDPDLRPPRCAPPVADAGTDTEPSAMQPHMDWADCVDEGDDSDAGLRHSPDEEAYARARRARRELDTRRNALLSAFRREAG
eukprot:11138178-Alexandrium_andersonii.AAC.1